MSDTDYGLFVYLEIKMLVDDGFYHSIHIRATDFNNNYDSDTQKEYKQDALYKYNSSTVIYQDGIWHVNNIDKYIQRLKKHNYDLSKIKSIVKITEECSRD